MAGAARLIAVLCFALGYVSQPLALDACAVSCEAARAARGPVVAAPCHHSSSCATQTTQPTASASAATPPAVVGANVVAAVEVHAIAVAQSHLYHPHHAFSPPPIPLRV